MHHTGAMIGVFGHREDTGRRAADFKHLEE